MCKVQGKEDYVSASHTELCLLIFCNVLSLCHYCYYAVGLHLMCFCDCSKQVMSVTYEICPLQLFLT